MYIRKDKNRNRKTETDKGRKNTKRQNHYKQRDCQEAAHTDTQTETDK